MKVYCIEGRASREIENPRAMTMKKGKPETPGIYPVHGTEMFRIGES